MLNDISRILLGTNHLGIDDGLFDVVVFVTYLFVIDGCTVMPPSNVDALLLLLFRSV